MIRGQLTPDLRWLSKCVGGDMAYLRGYWDSMRGGVPPNGTWRDLSTGASPGTLVGPAVVGTNGLVCNGSSGYATVAHTPSLATTKLTISLWVKDAGMSGNNNYALASKVAQGGKYVLSGYQIYYDNAAGTANFQVRNGTFGSVSGAVSLTEWAMLTGTFDGTNLGLYANGGTIDSDTHTGLNSNSATLSFGTQVDTSVGLNLQAPINMDGVLVFSESLSAAQIRAIYNASKWRFQ